ncbi:hypothetical protein [Candidatus Parabeggiatoa sp. HSG14]|uniref:hypothetical protein n=1 Tax=Candidatus Parabeggiatoa sp. HSG14 TaxID=3055593 RepID=UPI0025A8ED52|nr:hypothetical protein [Thiotrichales bacterium HSG14]
MKSFSKWTIEEVEEAFHLVSFLEMEKMTEWITHYSSFSHEEEILLNTLQKKLQHHVYDWNEQELIVYFIAPLLNLVDFEHHNYQAFLEREISVIYGDEMLSGVVDFVVAQGKRSPKHPFFFIHEYKKEYDSSNDPLGQLMIAMVAAQKLNNDNNPIYGAYVMGRYWHFVILNGLEYSINQGFNACKDEIKDILGILKNTKAIIEDLIQGNTNIK